ncbi:hypothetical protein [Cognatilysobacter terrigena]|uniref:hypothetical protein n=1 Tax=Cognatilysobacter terrigena TaxID=2488749 RepID=UPI0010608BAC|nr:hypothetical protein [Lysobacter terrigena]
MKKLPRHWIEHIADWRDAPMAYWVHVEPEGEDWRSATTYQPPAPSADGSNGFPLLCVESEGFVLVFSSAAQLSEAIRVLSLVPLPPTRRLSAQRPGAHGPNSHWLSRLPGWVKSPKTRSRIVEDLRSLSRSMAPNNSSKPTPLRGAA